jgi:hypothetical protein
MRKAIAFLIAGVASLGLPAAAFGNHLHSVQTGNGACVVLAQAGDERFVTLPEASFQNTSYVPGAPNPHPIHVHVHLGAAGDPLAIGVYGAASDPCLASGDYVNLGP